MIPYEVSLEDMYNGRTAHFSLEKNVVCGHCNGSGGKPGAQGLLARVAPGGKLIIRTGLDDDSTRAGITVLGMGKLGGRELNVSSDIDLVYAFAGGGESEPFSAQAGKPRALAAEEYFSRLGQRLARLLDETTAEGFSSFSRRAFSR